jgi:uncharacterized protein YjbI with pentapeptide repeats
MNNLRRWTAQFMVIPICLLSAFAAGQDTAGESSCTWPHEGTVYKDGNQVIQAEEIGQCIQEGKEIDINGAVIKGTLDLLMLEPKRKEDGTPVIYISKRVRITNSTFEGDVKVGSREPLRTGIEARPVIFEQFTQFEGTTFTDAADFIGVTFTRYATFFVATFDWYAAFTSTEFIGNVDFSGTKINGNALFESTTFTGYANFGRAEFGGAIFSGAKFIGETNFLGIDTNFALFSNAKFSKNADFSGIHLFEVDFSNANFEGEFRLDSAKVMGFNACSFWRFKVPDGKTVFTASRFDDKVILDASEFKDIDFSPYATLSNCETLNKTVFPPTFFSDQVNLRNAKVAKANFQEVFFTDLNLSGSTFDSLILTDTLYNRLFYSGSTEKFYTSIEKGFDAVASKDELENMKHKYDTFDKLRTNFKGFGQIELTNEAYYQKSLLEQNYSPRTETALEWYKFRAWLFDVKWPKGLGFWETVGLGWNHISYYISGYFVKPERAFWGSWLFILFFGLVYFFVDVISSRSAKKISDGSFSDSQVFQIAIPHKTDKSVKKSRNTFAVVKLTIQKLWNNLLFSFSKFTKLKLNRTPDKRIYWLENIEWFVGAVMLTALLFSIANSVPGLERIVGAILPG